jgi:SAM-dependent methyltransferase
MDFYAKFEVRVRDYPVIGLLPPDKLSAVAQFAELNAESRVIDFGCGYGEALRCWAERFGVSGLGIDVDKRHIEGAREAIAGHASGARIEYICADATQYTFEPGVFDLAACINASNMFGSADVMFRNAIRHMRRAIREAGFLLIVEPYYNTPVVPQALIDYEGPLRTEAELVDTIRKEGLELVCMLHSDVTDWDRYISSNNYHSVKWLRENRDHPDWQKRRAAHRRFQDMYIQYRRQYQSSVAVLMTAI